MVGPKLHKQESSGDNKTRYIPIHLTFKQRGFYGIFMSLFEDKIQETDNQFGLALTHEKDQLCVCMLGGLLKRQQ